MQPIHPYILFELRLSLRKCMSFRNSESFSNHRCPAQHVRKAEARNARIRGFLRGGSGLKSESSDCSTCHEEVSLHPAVLCVYSVQLLHPPTLRREYWSGIFRTHTVSWSRFLCLRQDSDCTGYTPYKYYLPVSVFSLVLTVALSLFFVIKSKAIPTLF